MQLKLTKHTRAAMIRVVYKDPIIGLAIHHLPLSPFTAFIAQKHCKQILRGDILAGVILSPS